MRNLQVTQARMATKESLNRYISDLFAERGLSAADVERRAAGKISHSLIAALAAGDWKNIRFATLRALAKGLGVAEERLFAVAMGAELQDFCRADFVMLAEKYQDLSETDKAEVDELLALLHREIERLRRRQGPAPAGNGPVTVVIRNDLMGSPRKGKRLNEYVRGQLKEKHLTLQEVERRSQQKISATYICNITRDRADNLTMEKVKALARGLGVAPRDIFDVLEIAPGAAEGNFQQSVFASLFNQYNALFADARKEMRLLLKIVDRELDQRQIRQLRLSTRLPEVVTASTELSLKE